MGAFPFLAACQARDAAWYETLIGHLNEEQKKDLQDVVKLAEQRKAAAGQSPAAVRTSEETSLRVVKKLLIGVVALAEDGIITQEKNHVHASL